MEKRTILLRVNGRTHETVLAPNVTLLDALRDLGHVDVKNGCGKGDCGACAVMLNGKVVNSCLVLAWQAEGHEILTNAGLGTIDKPHIIQEAFADAGAIQCGYCTPGMVMATKALLDRNPDPNDAEIREAISGNLCRCTGYGQIIAAVKLAASRLRDLTSSPASSRSEDERQSDSTNRIPVGSEKRSVASSRSEERRESAPTGLIPVPGEQRKNGPSTGADTETATKGGDHA